MKMFLLTLINDNGEYNDIHLNYDENQESYLEIINEEGDSRKIDIEEKDEELGVTFVEIEDDEYPEWLAVSLNVKGVNMKLFPM